MQEVNEVGARVSLAGELPVPEAARSRRLVDPSLAGCLVVGTFAILAFLYFGFFAFAFCDAWFGWNLLNRHIDERTGAVLRILYWPLIKLCERIGIP